MVKRYTIHPEFLMAGPYGTIPTNYASRGGSKIYNKAALKGFGVYNKAALKGLGKVYNKAALRGFGSYNKAAIKGFGRYSSAVNPSFMLIGGELDAQGNHIPGTAEESADEIAAWRAAHAAEAEAAAAETETAKSDAPITQKEVKEADKSVKALVAFGKEVGANPKYLIDHPNETLMFAQEYGPKVWRFLKGAYKKIYKLMHKFSRRRKHGRRIPHIDEINERVKAEAAAAWKAQQDSVLQPLPQKTDVEEVMDAMDEPTNTVTSIGADPVVEGGGWYYY